MTQVKTLSTKDGELREQWASVISILLDERRVLKERTYVYAKT